jgi:dihydroorotate dehydrogenase
MSARSTVLGVGYDTVLKPLLFRRHGGDPEAIHEEMIERLERAGASPAQRRAIAAVVGRARRPATVAGVRFPGRVGVAAGLDKDGRAARAWGSLGFGFAELGTVTALQQPGNDTPRLFRLVESQAIINRMGFNNAGAKALADRLYGWGVKRGEATLGIPLGISLGKSKVVPLSNAVADYLASFRMVAPYADYVAINVSSPNTPGLRGLQDRGALRDLVSSLTREASQIVHPLGPVPVFVKLAPDLTDAQIDEALEVIIDAGGRGVIATNTTLGRAGLAMSDSRFAGEPGGLSGAPLTARALSVVRRITAATTLPVIGVGGIMTADDAEAMFDAGARLVQVYTGFIFAGPALVAGINALEAR